MTRCVIKRLDDSSRGKIVGSCVRLRSPASSSTCFEDVLWEWLTVPLLLNHSCLWCMVFLITPPWKQHTIKFIPSLLSSIASYLEPANREAPIAKVKKEKIKMKYKSSVSLHSILFSTIQLCPFLLNSSQKSIVLFRIVQNLYYFTIDFIQNYVALYRIVQHCSDRKKTDIQKIVYVYREYTN